MENNKNKTMATMTMTSSNDTSTIFVGNLPRDITKAEFRDFFSQFGRVRAYSLKFNREGFFRGFGFITYMHPHVASRVAKLGSSNRGGGGGRLVMRGNLCTIKFSTSDGGSIGTIFVGDLPLHTTNNELFDFFQQFGTVTDSSYKYPCGYGFVTFADPAVACKLLKMRDNDWDITTSTPTRTDFTITEDEDDDTNIRNHSGPNLLAVFQDTVFVDGIPFDANEKQVRVFFEKTHSNINDIIELRLPTCNDISDRNRGFCYIKFASKESYDKALTLSGKYMGQRYLTIQPATVREGNGTSRDDDKRVGRIVMGGCVIGTRLYNDNNDNDNDNDLNHYQPEQKREHSSTVATLKRPVSSLLPSLSQSNLLTHKKARQCSNNSNNNYEEKRIDSPSSPVPSKGPSPVSSPSSSLLSLQPDLVVKRMNTKGENTVEEKVVVERNREMTLLPSSSSSSDTKNHDANDMNANDRDYNNNNKYAQLLKKHEKLKQMYNNKMKQNRQLEIECKDLQARSYEEGSLSNYNNTHREWDQQQQQQQQQQMMIESLKQKLVQSDQQWNTLSSTTSKQTNTINHMVEEKQIILQRLEDEVMIRHEAENLFVEEKLELGKLLEKEVSKRCQAEHEQEIIYKQLQNELKKRQTVEQEKYVLLYQQRKGDHPTKKEEYNIVKNEKYP